MKKLFISLTFLLCIVIISRAQDTTSYVSNSNVEKLIDKYSKKIEASVTALAESLKQPTEHIYYILVKKQKIVGYSSLLAILFSVLLFLAAVYLSNKDMEEGAIILFVISVVLFITSCACFVIDGLQGLLNPEYGAIKEIVKFIK